MSYGSSMRRLSLCRRTCTAWIVAFALVFLVIMPLVGQDLVFSVYRSAKWTYSSMQEKVADDHRSALRESAVYLRTLEWRNRPLLPDDDAVELAVAVVSSRRVVGSRPLGYLTRTVTALHQRVTDAADWPKSWQLLICDVNAGPGNHLEADRLRQYFHVVVRFPNASASATILDPFEKEKQDYAFCLSQALQFTSGFVLIVEDDAVAHDSLFHVLQHILQSKTLSLGTYSWSHLKLYYPERWQGFSVDARTLVELTALFCVTSVSWTAVLSICCQKQRQTLLHAVMVGIIAVLGALAVGRQHLVQLKRITPHLYSLSADPGCCSPAVLYNAAFAELLVPFLVHETRCSNSYPLDMALKSFVDGLQWPGYRIEPNLFRHIGLISTMKGPSRYIEDFLM